MDLVHRLILLLQLSFLSRFKRFGAVLGQFWGSLVQFGAVLVQIGAVWCSLEQFGAFWCSLVQFGAILVQFWCSSLNPDRKLNCNSKISLWTISIQTIRRSAFRGKLPSAEVQVNSSLSVSIETVPAI